MKVSTEACILGAWANYQYPKRILDIGTGTGLLALMLAQRYDCPIDAVEIDNDAAEQARDNVTNSPWFDKIIIHHMSIQKFMDLGQHHYDLIACNPPFFADHQKASLVNSNMALHEGKHFDQSVLREALDRLMTPQGVAWVLYPEFQANQFVNSIESGPLCATESLIIRNQPSGSTFRKIIQVSKKKPMDRIREISIREGKEYSSEYLNLMEDYYL